uniref:Uncharacterized protein n=1 Tax=uncultured bacterium A1Q1_fos_500 TaxID=1256579 RepID=L7VSH9_9BACT|nr:hypothetical protein [uncultured bacterium A1Q1_fos_500]
MFTYIDFYRNKFLKNKLFYEKFLKIIVQCPKKQCHQIIFYYEAAF